MIKPLLIIFTFLIIKSFSQDSRKIISGKILVDSLSTEGIHVINKTSGIATLSNTLGEFRIKTKPKDTLVFSSIQFVNRKIEVTKKHFRNLVLVVKLEIDINMLDEVTLKNNSLVGNLSVDVSLYHDSIYELTAKALDFSNIDFSQPVVNDFDEIDLSEAPDPSELTTPEVADGVDIYRLLVNPFVKTISKIGEKRRQQKRIEFESTRVPDKIRLDFSNKFFNEQVKIPTPEIDAFIAHCMKKGIANLYLKNQKIELIELMLTESTVFLETINNEEK